MQTQTLTQFDTHVQLSANIKKMFTKMIMTMECWHKRHQTREQLAKLPKERLNDIGLTTTDQQLEASKHFWE